MSSFTKLSLALAVSIVFSSPIIQSSSKADSLPGRCSVLAISDGPGITKYTQQISSNADTKLRCIAKLNEQVYSWCNSIPIEGGGRYCRSDDSTLSVSGFATLPAKPAQCIAYEHGWLNGSRITMTADQKVDLRNETMNDEISSTWTAESCRLSVYKHSNYQGYLMDLGPGENKTLGINDIISSMECKCK